MEALRKVLASDEFVASPQLSAFLTFAVGRTVEGRGETLKAYTIATEVFRRDASFDPQLDPIVRVEATRLRRALERYYGGAGASDPVRIILPRGSYIVQFEEAPGESAAPMVRSAASVHPSAGGSFIIDPVRVLRAQGGDRRGSGNATIVSRIGADAADRLDWLTRFFQRYERRQFGWSMVFLAMFVPFTISLSAVKLAPMLYPRGIQPKAFAVTPVPTATASTPRASVVSDRLASIIVEPVKTKTGEVGTDRRVADASIDAIQDDLREALSRFDTISVLMGNEPAMVDQNALFVLNPRIVAGEAGDRLVLHLSQAHFGVIVWSASYPVSALEGASREATLADITTAIASEGSATVRHIARQQQGSESGGGPGCLFAVNAAHAYPSAGNLELAVNCSGNWTQANPRSAMALRLSARMALMSSDLGGDRSGAIARAYADVRQAIALNPDSATAHNVLADVLMARGQVSDALSEGRLAVRLNSFDQTIRNAQAERMRRAMETAQLVGVPNMPRARHAD